MTSLIPLLVLCSLAPARQAGLADSLFQNGLPRAAVTEYKRCLYHGEDSTGLLGLKLGLALGLSGETESAIRQLEKTRDEHPELSYASGTAAAGLLSANRSYERAKLALLDLLLFTADSVERNAILRGLAWLDLIRGNETGAADFLEKSGRPELASEVRRAAEIKGRNPTVAVLLSSIVPGAGEAYAGRPLAGLLGLAVTGGSAAGTYLAAKSGDWVTAAVVFSFFFLRFYNGSRSNAANFCSDYREETIGKRFEIIARQDNLEPDWFAPAESLTGFSLTWPIRPGTGPWPGPAPAGHE